MTAHDGHGETLEETMSYTVEQYTHRNDISWANVLVDLVCGIRFFRLLSIESKHVLRELLSSNQGGKTAKDQNAV